jgi:PST family polysaccharide transporter
MESVTRGYTNRALSALKWGVSGDLVEQGLRSTFGIALARLLSPRDFGQLAMLMVVIQFVSLVSDLGFEDALIQKRDLGEAHQSSVFWLRLLVGSAFTVGLIAGAPGIAAFYGVEELVPLAVALSVLLTLDAIGTVPRALVTRRLEFRVIAWLQCAAATFAGAVAVTLAWLGFGVMSLAADLLVTTTLQTVLFFLASAWRPRFEVRMAALGDLFGFSSYRLADRVLSYSAQLDLLLVGKFLGSGALGFYTRAYNLARFPIFSVSRSIGRVMFPTFALMQHDPERVRDVYLRATGAVALATFPMCLGFLAAAEPLIIGVLGAQWRETVSILRILSLAGAVQSVTLLTNGLCLSLGRTHLQLRLTGLQRVSTVAAILLGLQWGLLGLATAYTLAAFFNSAATLHFAGRLTQLRTRVVLARLWPVFLASLVMAAVVLGIDAWTAPRLPALGRLGLEVVVAIPIYWGALQLLRVPAYGDALGLLRQPSASTPRPAI